MKKVIVFLAMAAMVSVPVAWADGGSVTVLGSYTDPITGQSTQFVNAKSNDAWRQNQSVIYAMTTDQQLVTLPNGTKRWQSVTTMASHDNAMSTGLLNTGIAGFIGNLPNAGGLIGAGALLRPSNTSVNNQNQGNGSTMSQGGQVQTQGQLQAQRQRQGQAQGQSQGNVNTFTPTNVNTNVNTPVNTFTPVNSNILKQGQSTGPLSPVNVF